MSDPTRRDLDGCLGLTLGMIISLAVFGSVMFLAHECYHRPGVSHELSEEPPPSYERVQP